MKRYFGERNVFDTEGICMVRWSIAEISGKITGRWHYDMRIAFLDKNGKLQTKHVYTAISAN